MISKYKWYDVFFDVGGQACQALVQGGSASEGCARIAVAREVCVFCGDPIALADGSLDAVSCPRRHRQGTHERPLRFPFPRFFFYDMVVNFPIYYFSSIYEWEDSARELHSLAVVADPRAVGACPCCHGTLAAGTTCPICAERAVEFL